jgi:hypothetical protein
MAMLLRGALVEYGGEFLGQIPNIVVFQFNPEQLARTITIAPRNDQATGCGTQQLEWNATCAPPTESFTITAHFSAADELGKGGELSAVARLGTRPQRAAMETISAIPRLFGIGPQLAALEKMVYPPRPPGGAIGAAIDAVGSALSTDTGAGPGTPVPRVRVPKILFIWGHSRILPVSVKTMTITENKFDFLLNPVQAEVALGLEVPSQPPQDDGVAKGALDYTNTVKDAQAKLNLTNVIKIARATFNLDNTVDLARDIVPF